MGANGNGTKRGPGRPPGPCPTPYRRYGSVGVARTVGVPDLPVPPPEFTREETARLTGYLGQVDALARSASMNDATARAELATRFKCAVGSGGPP